MPPNPPRMLVLRTSHTVQQLLSHWHVYSSNFNIIVNGLTNSIFPPPALDEDEESGPGQTVYADFDYSMCFLIGGRLKLDYDENMALLKVNRHLALFRIQHYNHPGLQGIRLHRCKYSWKVSNSRARGGSRIFNSRASPGWDLLDHLR